MNRSNLVIVMVAVLSGVVGLVAGRSLMTRGSAIAPRVAAPADVARKGDALPAIELPDLHGATRSLAQWQGKPVLINFWATWCGPCIEEMPALDAFQREQGPDGVQVIGIALDDETAVRGFLAKTPVAYTILVDMPHSADSSVRLGNTRGALPYSVIVGANGRIAGSHYGGMDLDGIRRLASLGSDGP